MADATPRPVGRILKAAEAGLYHEATCMLEAAKHDAARLRETAEAEIADLRARALQQAEHDAAMITLRAEEAALAAAQRSIASLQQDIAETIVLAVTRILGRMETPNLVGQAARHAIDELAARHGVVVHVHHDCVQQTRTALAGADPHVRIVGDGTLPADACMLETDAGIVRAGLSEQVQALRKALCAASGGPAA